MLPKFEAGQWWESRCGSRRYVVGVNPRHNGYPFIVVDEEGDTAEHTEEGHYYSHTTSDYDLVKHLPDCTGFDWVEPVEPDWVELTDPTHVMRRGMDQIRVAGDPGDTWDPVNGFSGDTVGEYKGVYEVRCLRADLPVPPKKRVPVRLWNHNGAVRCEAVDQHGQLLNEIHSDGSGGWYVEDPS